MNPIFQLASILWAKKKRERRCPTCGHVFSVPEREAAATVRCPKCAANVVAPSAPPR